MLHKIGTPVMYIDDFDECDYPVGTLGVIVTTDYESPPYTALIDFRYSNPTWHCLSEVAPISKISKPKDLPCQP